MAECTWVSSCPDSKYGGITMLWTPSLRWGGRIFPAESSSENQLPAMVSPVAWRTVCQLPGLEEAFGGQDWLRVPTRLPVHTECVWQVGRRFWRLYRNSGPLSCSLSPERTRTRPSALPSASLEPSRQRRCIGLAPRRQLELMGSCFSCS